jgi:hypothetical protein
VIVFDAINRVDVKNIGCEIMELGVQNDLPQYYVINTFTKIMGYYIKY